MMNYIYVYINNEWNERANEICTEIRSEGGSWAWIKSARELLLIEDTLFADYNRVIINLPANDIGVACACVIKDKAFGLSWTAHYAGNGYHDYMDLIRREMKI